MANSVFVSSGNVYVAGVGHDGAMLWKDGNLQNLSDSNFLSEACSVFVSGDDVYVAGQDEQIRSRLWKNGVVQYLSLGRRANSVFVDRPLPLPVEPKE
jgi:hypothetical protein